MTKVSFKSPRAEINGNGASRFLGLERVCLGRGV